MVHITENCKAAKLYVKYGHSQERSMPIRDRDSLWGGREGGECGWEGLSLHLQYSFFS